MSDLSISPVAMRALLELPELPPQEAPKSPLEALTLDVEAGGLGDPRTNGVAALGIAPEAATTLPEAQVDGGHEYTTATPTLALMAQAVQGTPRQDGPAPSAVEANAAPRHEAAIEAGTPAEAGAAPLPSDLPATVAVASLLHVTAPAFRARTDASPGADERGHLALGADADEDDGDAAPDGEEPSAEAPEPVTSPLPAASGDPVLYARIVERLQALAGESAVAGEVLGELRRQRRVVLVTPSTLLPGPKCPAHVDVLWPLPTGGRALRLAGELWWARVPVADTWWCAHLVRSRSADHQHHLAPRPGDDLARDVAVCLGSQALAAGAGAQVCVRVRDTTRLWRALEPQWSLRVAVGTRPWSARTAPRPEIGHVA